MRSTPYYSVRTGKHPTGGRLDFDMFVRMFVSCYSSFVDRGYFQEVFGYECVDAGVVHGLAGSDTQAFVFQKLRKDSIWPVFSFVMDLSEDDVFDLVELLYDTCSKGTVGYEHTFAECGWHFREFDREEGRKDYRLAINEILRDYDTGYELRDNGEIIQLAPPGLSELLDAPVPHEDGAGVTDRIADAIAKFRRRGSSISERRDCVRDLADVLERLRPEAKQVLAKKDESDLFEIANNFGIRHNNEKQRVDYDASIWLSWMFYYYLATIHALVRLTNKAREHVAKASG